MTTLRQAEANRRNSLLSTGPRTEVGKSRSRLNSLRDGLSGAGELIPADMADDVADRVACFHTGLHAADDYDEWLIVQAATESVKLDRLRLREAALLSRAAQRATRCWDDDRGLQAAELATRLARDPEATSRRLRQTPQGCALLVGRWEALARAVAVQGAWDEAQRSLALDLLGVPAVLRGAGLTELDGAPGDDVKALTAAVAARELAQLARPERVELLAELDALDRAQAERGLDVGEGRDARLVARYEAAAARRLAWALGELKQRKADRARHEEAGRRAAEEVLRRKEHASKRALREAEAVPGVSRPPDLGGPFDPASDEVLPVSATPAVTPPASAAPQELTNPWDSLSARATLGGAAVEAPALTPPPAKSGGSRRARKQRARRERLTQQKDRDWRQQQSNRPEPPTARP